MGSAKRFGNFNLGGGDDDDDESGGQTYGHRGRKACRVCDDFKSWHRKKDTNSTDFTNAEDTGNLLLYTGVTQFTGGFQPPSVKTNEKSEQPARKDCPLDVEELGRNTWSFLHTMAAYYPERPSEETKTEMTNFIDLFAKFYPCEVCAEDFRACVRTSRPDVTDMSALSRWMCQQHNIVNEKLGKPQFDCSKVLERWKDGWRDGSCD